MSERQTRFATLIEAPISKSLLVSGYGEFDFLGSATSSNLGQANSFVPRIRNLYTTLDSSDYGFHVLAGQNWSLVTMNSKGITPRNEVTPPQIDAGFIPGFEFARLPQIRITKDFNKKLWIALDAESSQTNNGGGACANIVSNTSNRASGRRRAQFDRGYFPTTTSWRATASRRAPVAPSAARGRPSSSL